MARGIYTSDFIYEIDNSPTNGTTPTLISSMLIRMDKFNVGTTEDKIKKSNVTVPVVPAHVVLDLNEREFGIHPRYLVCRLDLTGASSNCNGSKLRRFVHIPVLTIAQFLAFNLYVKDATTQPQRSSLKVNHSYNGSGFATYNIMRKVAQTLI